MGNEFNGSAVQVGDSVIVVSCYYAKRLYYIGKVVKKTPTGLLDVTFKDGQLTERFRPNGCTFRKADRWSNSSTYLRPYNEEFVKYLRARQARAQMISHLSKVDWGKYSNEDLDKIVSYLSKISTK